MRCPVSGWLGDEEATGVESQVYSGRGEMSRIFGVAKGRRSCGAKTWF